jgi:hypothetical protein
MEYCDACGGTVAALWCVTFKDNRVLYFCNHHSNKLYDSFTAVGGVPSAYEPDWSDIKNVDAR